MSCSRKKFDFLWMSENECEYSIYVWDKHSTTQSFSQKCNIPSCIQRMLSFQRHVKREQKWFFEKYMIILYISRFIWKKKAKF